MIGEWLESESTFHFAGYDGNGNVAGLVGGATGTINAAYEYGPFGEALRVTSSLAKTNLTIRFSSKYTDDESDLVYYGHRYYTPNMGRWLSKDPLGELAGINEYSMCINDPLNRFDIHGLLPTGLGGIITSCLKELIKQGFLEGVGGWLDKSFACGQMATLSRSMPDVDLCKGHAENYDFAARKDTSLVQSLLTCVFGGLSGKGVSDITDPLEKEIAKRILETGGKITEDNFSSKAKMRIYGKCVNGEAQLLVNYVTEISAFGKTITRTVEAGEAFGCPKGGPFHVQCCCPGDKEGKKERIQ